MSKFLQSWKTSVPAIGALVLICFKAYSDPSTLLDPSTQASLLVAIAALFAKDFDVSGVVNVIQSAQTLVKNVKPRKVVVKQVSDNTPKAQ